MELRGRVMAHVKTLAVTASVIHKFVFIIFVKNKNVLSGSFHDMGYKDKIWQRGV